jgi:zinc transporter ZupT
MSSPPRFSLTGAMVGLPTVGLVGAAFFAISSAVDAALAVGAAVAAGAAASSSLAQAITTIRAHNNGTSAHLRPFCLNISNYSSK